MKSSHNLIRDFGYDVTRFSKSPRAEPEPEVSSGTSSTFMAKNNKPLKPHNDKPKHLRDSSQQLTKRPLTSLIVNAMCYDLL
jgi:hypothetical protein